MPTFSVLQPHCLLESQQPMNREGGDEGKKTEERDHLLMGQYPGGDLRSTLSSSITLHCILFYFFVFEISHYMALAGLDLFM